MRICPAALCAASLLSTAPPAGAAWLQCTATGASDAGPTVFFTTVAQVPQKGPATASLMQNRLVTYTHSVDPTLRQISARCTLFDEMADATNAFNTKLDEKSRTLGWEHIIVLLPGDWIPLGRVKGDRTS